MKNIFWFVLLLPLVTYAQVSDDFESGSVSRWIFNRPGAWAADNTASISGLLSLHHVFDNAEAGVDMAGLDISTLRSDLGDITWQFKVRHGYDPSSSNNWGIYLIADSEPSFMAPGETASGFVAGVNMKGYDDTLRIWRVESGNLIHIVTSVIDWQEDIGISDNATVRIERSVSGEWKIYVGIDESVPVIVGEGSDETWYPNQYFGICYRYTSSLDRLFWFDDLIISGEFVEDNQAPALVSSLFTSSSSILLDFNEPISTNLIKPDNFFIENNSVSPHSVQSFGNQIVLQFADKFENKREYSVVIDQLCDSKGNCRNGVVIPVLLAYPEWGDIVISEFLADPTPSVHLPACEYVELFNSADFEFDLMGMGLEIGTRRIELPPAKLDAHSYLVICDDNCDWPVTSGVDIIGHDDFPSIANGGAMMILADTAGKTLHGLNFNSTWFNDVLKAEGGWSMEMIDTDYPFQAGDNWRFSTNRNGGTPGFTNSVKGFNPDTESPWVDNVYPVSDTTLIVNFSEPVDIQFALTEMWEGINYEVFEIEEASGLRGKYRLSLREKLLDGNIYDLTVPDAVTDFNNNSLIRRNMGFGLPANPLWNDLVINEILFDPLVDEDEFIEIYNRSNLVFDASGLFISSLNNQTGDTGKPVLLSGDPRCIMPGDYFVISTGKKSVVNSYISCDRYYIFETGSMPSLPDDKGALLLFTREHDPVDRVSYSDEMHFDLLSGTEGVSLERIDASAPSETRFNWHSASGVSGWGTPGIKNSVVTDGVENGGAVHLSSSKLSPDNDGFEDILQIRVDIPEPGFVIRCIIYNDMGFKSRTLVNSTTSGTVNNLYWDGTSDNGTLLPRGIYIIYIEVTGSRGEVSVFRKACAILR